MRHILDICTLPLVCLPLLCAACLERNKQTLKLPPENFITGRFIAIYLSQKLNFDKINKTNSCFEFSTSWSLSRLTVYIGTHYVTSILLAVQRLLSVTSQTSTDCKHVSAQHHNWCTTEGKSHVSMIQLDVTAMRGKGV